MSKKIIGVVALTLCIPLLSLAATVKVGEEYTLPKAEKVFDNLYVGSSNAVIAGDVSGDAVVAGGSVLITGTVAEDVLAAGGTINILGAVNEDLRAAGGQITIGGIVGGDGLIGGGQVHLVSGSRINGDLIITGGRVVIDGEVRGVLKIFGGEVNLNNAITSNVEVSAGELTLGEGATIGGNILYRGEKEAIITEGALISGKYTFEQIHIGRGSIGARAFFESFRAMRFLITLICALFIFWLMREKVQQLTDRTLRNFKREFLRGVVVSIVLPIASIIALMTLVGLPIGFIGLLTYGIVATIGALMSGVVLGVLLKKIIFKKGEQVTWITVAGGVVAMTIVRMIPVVGWIIGALITVATIGSLYYALYQLLRRTT